MRVMFEIDASDPKQWKAFLEFRERIEQPVPATFKLDTESHPDVDPEEVKELCRKAAAVDDVQVFKIIADFSKDAGVSGVSKMNGSQLATLKHLVLKFLESKNQIDDPKPAA